MDRREFLQSLAVTAACAETFSGTLVGAPTKTVQSVPLPDLQGNTLICEFKLNTDSWKVYEDLRTRDGDITFVSAAGASRRMVKSAEASFQGPTEPYVGLRLNEIGLAGADLLADRLLAGGDDPDHGSVDARPRGFG